MKTSGIFILIMFFCSASGKGQTYSYTRSMVSSVTVSQVMGLSITQNNTYTYNFTTINQIRNGITNTNMNTIAVKSNVPWNLSVKSSTPYFTNSGTYSSSNMPANVLRITTSLQTVNLSTTDQLMYSGIAGDATKTGNTFPMTMYANPGFSYGPGSYTINIVYTLTAQ
jgi:hypothetical protein